MGHCLTSKGSSLIEQRQAQAQMQGAYLGRPGRWRGQKQGQHKRREGQHKPQVQGRRQRRQWWERQRSAIMGRTQAAASAAGTAGRTCLPSLASGERRRCGGEGRRLARAYRQGAAPLLQGMCSVTDIVRTAAPPGSAAAVRSTRLATQCKQDLSLQQVSENRAHLNCHTLSLPRFRVQQFRSAAACATGNRTAVPWSPHCLSPNPAAAAFI